MKQLTMNLAIAAVALGTAAGSASAQTLKADIPFTFRAAHGVLAPGTYEVRMKHSASSGTLVLQNAATGRSVFLPVFLSKDTSKEWKAAGQPKLGFECELRSCVLEDIWIGGNVPTYRIPMGKTRLGGDLHAREIRMTPAKAD